MSKNGKQVLDKSVRFRLTSKELERVENECDKYGISKSEYCRSAVLKKRIRFKIDADFNQNFAEVRSDFDAILSHVNTVEKIDMITLEEMVKISQKLDRILDDNQTQQLQL